MKLNKQEQLQLEEDLFRLFISEFVGWTNVTQTWIQAFDVKDSNMSNIYTLFPKETHPISAEVYVSDDCKKRIYNGRGIYNSVVSNKELYYKNKARIELVEE